MVKDSTKMNMGTIVEAKVEYTKQMVKILQPLIYEAVLVLYTSSVHDDPNNIIEVFEEELRNVPKWNNDVIKSENDRLKLQCSYFDDLLTAVVLSNVRILTSIRMGSKKKVQISIPSTMNFIHQIYINVSKDILNNLQLFDVDTYNGTVTKNISAVYDLIADNVENTIRDVLPLKEILVSSLHSHVKDSDGEESDNEGSISEDNEPLPDSPRNAEPITTPPTGGDAPTEPSTSFINDVLHDSDGDDVKTVPMNGDHEQIHEPCIEEPICEEPILEEPICEQPPTDDRKRPNPSFLD